jgi:hypothetical protein
MLAVVMPIHRLHLPYAQLFVRSLHWCRAEEFPFFPVFATDADMLAFTDLIAGEEHLPTEPLVVPPDPRNPSTSQKWRALRAVFSGHLTIRYALTLDAETALIGPARSGHVHEWLANWSARRAVLGSSWKPRVGGGYFDRRPPAQNNATLASCAALGLSASEASRVRRMLPVYFAWSDAPLFEREDFEEFWGRVTTHGFAALGRSVFDDASYLCFKLLQRNWTLVDVNVQSQCPGNRNCNSVELATLAEQRAIQKAHRYSFIWLAANLNAFRPGRPQPRRLLMHHLEHMGGTSDSGDHYDNFEGFGSMWRAKMVRLLSRCTEVTACEQRAQVAWGLSHEAFECSAARVFAHVHVLAVRFKKQPLPRGDGMTQSRSPK